MSRVDSKSGSGSRPAKADKPGYQARRLAIEALIRMEVSGAYVNIMLPKMLEKSELALSDKKFVTELVYGTTRMKLSCDALVRPHLSTVADDEVTAALRVGAYQLYFLSTPPHASVDATVGAVSGRGGSVVNAVLRKLSKQLESSKAGLLKSASEKLSYPTWIIEEFESFLDPVLGAGTGLGSLEAMNRPAKTTIRDDGYTQDEASQMVVEAVDGMAGEIIVDLCSAPGGKATGIAATGATVIAGDRKLSRAKLVKENAVRVGVPDNVHVYVASGEEPPFADAIADKVLVDAPCSGLGSLRRRPDARWRVEPETPERLLVLQKNLVEAGLRLLKPGGVLTYSVCTLGEIEGDRVIESALAIPNVELVNELSMPKNSLWCKVGQMMVIPPGETDGMMLAQLRLKA